MASSDRMIKNFPRIPGKDARTAAVLILLYPDNGSVHTVLCNVMIMMVFMADR